MSELERTSLEAHVDLCALRYNQLDQRMTSLEDKVDAIQREIIEGQKSLKTTIITTTGSVVVALVGVIATLLIKF